MGFGMILDVYNLKAEKVGEQELKEEVFGIGEEEINIPLIHQVVVAQLNKKRKGTASTKTRSEVSLSTRKLYRQKGTGRARAGSAGSPTRVGGGVAHGPKPRSYEQKVPKKMKKLALKMALSSKISKKELILLDEFSLESHKTKAFEGVLRAFNINQKVLIVSSDLGRNLDLSTRNLQHVKVMKREGINVYDVLNYQYLMIDRPSILSIQEALER
ncbi:MAG: 50S ribosomal protein L4 [Desulfatiglandales bacterium]